MFLKKILLVIFTGLAFTAMAQTSKEYAKNWAKAAAFEKKGLTKSALQEVLVIYNMAVKDNNDAQQINAAIYQVKYHNIVQEDSRENNIFYIDTLIAKAKTPAKNILQSMQAEMFWQYLQNNRYKFYDRTAMVNEKSNDITTWSLNKLHATIGKLYKASLANESLLQTTKIDRFDPVIIKGENTRQLRPTLFDFLAFRALDYFKNDERDLIKPAYQFTIHNPKAFAPAAEFAATSFTTKDTAALYFKAIELLQEIIRFHLKDKSPDALLDADLIRLNFVQQYAVNGDKSSLYEAAFKNTETKYADNEAAAQAMYLRAQIYFEKGQLYDPFTATTNQYEIKRAKELCELAAKKFPKSEGGINAQNLLKEILQPALTLETEKVNIPDVPFRTLVNYKNAATIYFRVLKTNSEAIKKMDNRNDDKLWKDIVALKPAKTWSVTLPDLQDYQSHAAEIKIDALPNGTYFILASLDKDFSLQKNIIAKQLTYISNISYINNNKQEYYILNRDNGQPYNNASVQVWEKKYNYTSSQNEDTRAESYTTDKNGFFKLKKTKEYRNIKLQIKTGSDEFFLQEEAYNTYYNSYEQTPQPIKPITFLFTDRSIYRPGQTVYFKGIVLQKGNKATETIILPAFNTSLQLRDANNQKVADVQLLTNEFGSYHGSFKLPEGTLNGQFNLFDTGTNSQQYFSVEEYKRPRFFTEVQKPTGTYRLMDSITITGTAKAYAGNNIDGAKVKYRVVRKVRYPIWWAWGGSGGYIRKGRPGIPMGNSNEVEITNGETITDANGTFNISFKALPDESVDKKTQPVFYYEVNADITDLNGETRSGNTTVAVAWQMLQLEIKVAEKLSVDSLKNILVKSTNLNDIKETTNATVTIQQLKSPAKIFRERYWEQPDQFVMSKNEYYGYFPYDVYKNENEVKNYEAGNKIFEKTDSTNGEWAIVNGQFRAGWYKIVATAKDKYGEEVKTEKYIQLYSSTKKAASTIAVEVRVENNAAEPGQKIQYNITTGFPNIWLIHILSKMEEDNKISYQTITTNQPYQNEIPVAEKDRGGIAVSYVFVQHNRVYKGNESFDIPWSNKELTIDYATFRDKLLPGSEEKWTVKISGNKGEKVVAEMLAAMYDASLNQFKPHNWSAFNFWPKLYSSVDWSSKGFEGINSEEYNRSENENVSNKPKSYDQLLYSKNSYGGRFEMERGMMAPGDMLMKAPPQVSQMKFTPPKVVKDKEVKADELIKLDSAAILINNKPKTENQSIQIRKNFNETAFFFPDLQTDADGNVSFSFTIPEALTEWKLMTFSHTKNLASGYTEKTTVTQKPLMIQPNAPRFLREGDGIEFSAKVVNLTDKEITGTTQLELLDAATNKPVDGWFKNIFPTQYFTVAAGRSAAVKFPMEVPFNFNSAMTYRVVAKSSNNPADGNFSDGEEMALPVLTNRMLVTESMPINLRNETTKHFEFEKLLNSGSSQTLTNHALTVEYTSNPVWYAVQALPYLMEYPYECAEQTFNKYYANTLASFVSNSMPKIKAVFEKWKTADTTALLSNLQKNEELKSALLQETPWVLAAHNESQQKKNIALLFDMVKMSSETDKAITRLKDMQSSNGGFVWFKGGPDDRYITQYILTGIGHLKTLNALSGNNARQLKDIMVIVNKAIPYLDKKIKEEYDNLLKYKAVLKNNNLSNTAVQYLYMRSFFTETSVAAVAQTAYNYYRLQAQKYWLSNSKYMQAMIALALHRSKDEVTPKAIIQSLKENAINKEELGMYWKEWTTGGYYWYQAPIESQALMIEAFTEIDTNNNTIDDLKTWLLKQKQTQNWKTTKATAEACYALLLSPTTLQRRDLQVAELNAEWNVVIMLGGQNLNDLALSGSSKNPPLGDGAAQAGTGYIKKTIEAKSVKTTMGNISVTMKSSQEPPLGGRVASWGSVYWQYFEDLDKITSAVTPLQVTKKLFIEKNTDKGPLLQAIADGAELKVGDKVKVRIELKVDRDMEYVHMKDMRAACMEPVNVISQYKWQGGLGYYESTKDASTNFFFGWLPRGSYVFEYPLFVTHAGNFSNGITSIQCMYAPEFTSHSEGIRVNVAP